MTPRGGCPNAASGRGLLLTQLGEAITSAEAAVLVRDHYLVLSIRFTRWDFGTRQRQADAARLDLSLAECERHLQTLAATAESTGSALWLDMEDSSYVDRTLDLYFALKKNHPSTGIALQAYLRRTPGDLARLIPLSGDPP